MILVTVGTTQYPFNRLAKAINEYASKNSKEKIVIQSGHTEKFEKAQGITNRSFYNFVKLQYLIKTARIVITHAGEGSVYQALNLSKNPPIVFPRNPKFGEHVNNQQLEIANVIDKQKLALVVYNRHLIARTLDNYSALSKNLLRYQQQTSKTKIIAYLTNFVEKNN